MTREYAEYLYTQKKIVVVQQSYILLGEFSFIYNLFIT